MRFRRGRVMARRLTDWLRNLGRRCKGGGSAGRPLILGLRRQEFVPLTPGGVSKLDVHSGDRLVVTYPGAITADMRLRLSRAFERSFPDVETVLRDMGMSLTLARKAQPNAAD